MRTTLAVVACATLAGCLGSTTTRYEPFVPVMPVTVELPKMMALRPLDSAPTVTLARTTDPALGPTVVAAADGRGGLVSPLPPKRPAKGVVTAVEPDGSIQLARADCYTVDMFSDAKIKRPDPEVPKEWSKFLGVWGQGAWGGKWCHEIHVTEIMPDGTVTVIDTHAPYEPWAKPATAYRRAAKMGEDGKLYLNYGRVKVVYEMRDGRLFGSRKEGGSELAIELSPQS